MPRSADMPANGCGLWGNWRSGGDAEWTWVGGEGVFRTGAGPGASDTFATILAGVSPRPGIVPVMRLKACR